MRSVLHSALYSLLLCATPLAVAQHTAKSSAPSTTVQAVGNTGACPDGTSAERQAPWRYSSPAPAFSSLAPCTTLSAAAAQQAMVSSALAATIQVLGSSLDACPVSMTLERQAIGQREWIVALEDGDWMPRTVRANKAGVHVQLDAAKNRYMSQAEVAVYYMPPVIHARPLNESAGGTVSPINLRKTFVLSAANAASARQLAGSLLVGPAASITRVRLLSITYSDGSTWYSDRANNCSASPGLFMAVAER